ncbi:hypothetical protein BARVI_04985 [Barnesiella viscericola DSM 18177]|uniref:SusD-like N-terminal domain-containing protein n=1 Tax=Barnesiella viscericola DSM 18177 TaxID=880074 RepID=W0ESF2_9BACT|nr:RagB/SusD family nutrient uptake outer membrane protein [Barnesiella viscericola]AHF13730.1 hypothetical protein BARVI_04985 [Barnesiella viscericola DSM 18177]
MKLNRFLYIGAAAMLSLTSCNDFLDKLPDNRIDPNNPSQLQLILAGGYLTANYGPMCELSSDNIVDNHAPDARGINYPNLTAHDPIDDQYFAWEDANMSSAQDSPTAVWSGCYYAIAAANHVLEKVSEFKAEGRTFNAEDQARLNAAYGEALVMRAYYHFLLVNLFAPQYRGEASASDMGVPYVTVPEKVVHVNYQRESVKAVYDKIEADLVEGMQYINDQYYEVPKYHFTKTATNAFAARFYLYKRDYEKVEQYATAALGSNPSQMLRSEYWRTNYTSTTADAQGYFSSLSSSNFQLLATDSYLFYTICVSPTSGGSRYALNRDAATSTLYGSGPTWNNYIPSIVSRLYVNGQQQYGLWPSWQAMQIEYTDKVAQIGYPKAIRAEFSGEETLLMRAEARVYLGNIAGAVEDLNYWNKSHSTTTSEMPDLTADLIADPTRGFYIKDNATTGSSDPRPYILQDLHIDEVCPVAKYTVTEDKLPYLWCVLHFRRIETVMTGMRWFDIKRYGIEITHKIGTDRVETLTTFDPRRAFQVPIESISSGLEPTPRTTKSVDESQFRPVVVDGTMQ